MATTNVQSTSVTLTLDLNQVNTIFVALQRNQDLIAQTMEQITKQVKEQQQPQDLVVQP